MAAEDALFLARGCEKVYLIHRRDQLRAAGVLQEKLRAAENVELVWSTEVTRVNVEEHVESIWTRKKDGTEQLLEVDGLFIAVGNLPQTELVAKLLQLDETGYIPAGENCVTELPGVFAAGDIRTKQLRQVVTAVADGANAVASVQEYLYKMI